MTFGGNKNFWDFIIQYKLERANIKEKYKSKAAQYYKKRLTNLAVGKEFWKEPPAKNYEEQIDRGMDSAKNYSKKAETGISKMGNYIEKTFNKFVY